MDQSNYQSVIDYLYSQLPMYQRVGATALKKDLENIVRLTKALGQPQDSLKSIHIAGTNGKGTTAHLIAALLQSSGYKVGLYTSPHYLDFRERIKIDGVLISEDDVVSFVQRIKPELKYINASFFEITVAMAFDYFERKDVDFAIIETGLGGRLDSTNIIDPLYSVITQISLDHQDMLGEDVYTISHEKAGIIKRVRPVVIGRYQSSCDQVFIKSALSMDAPYSFASLEWSKTMDHQQVILSRVEGALRVRIPDIDESIFFMENAATALEVVYQMSKDDHLGWSKLTISQALSSYRAMTNYIGRWQVLGVHPRIIADSAHNEDALGRMIHRIKADWPARIHYVLGFVRGKDLSHLSRVFEASDIIYLSSPDIMRGRPATEVSDIISDLTGASTLIYESVGTAIEAAQKAAGLQDLIYIGGSSFVVAEALAWHRDRTT